MPLTDNFLTLKESHKFLELNGVDWTFQWFRTLVWTGKIPSTKILNSIAVARRDLEKIVKDHKDA